jgi:hypothetical protein
VYFLVAWPYLLGTYLAVQLGAGHHSTTRTATGWAFEAGVVAIAAFVIARTAAASKARRANERQARERQAAEAAAAEQSRLVQRRQDEAAALEKLQRDQGVERERVLAELEAVPDGIPAPGLTRGEQLLHRFDYGWLVEPRSAYRGEPKVATKVDDGAVLITTRGVRFLGTQKNVEWRYDRMLHMTSGVNAVEFSVSNRQLISGVAVPIEQMPALSAAIAFVRSRNNAKLAR